MPARRANAGERRLSGAIAPAAGRNPTATERIAAGTLTALAIGVVAHLSVARGAFFDDEIWTLQFLAANRGWSAIIAGANSGDVHPPLSYLIFALLKALFGTWPAVKLALGWFNAVCVGGSSGRREPRCHGAVC